MLVIRDLSQARLEQDSVLTIGAFDGLHLGHQELVRRLIRSARESSRLSGVVTFDPLPRTVLAPDNSFICLTTSEDKIELLGDWGVDVLIIIPFTMEVANTTARDFILRLRERARMTELWVGWNFALGRGREGNVENLRRLGQELGYRLQVIEPVSDGAVPVSSTQIRHLLASGRVREAAEMLGRYYQLRGIVPTAAPGEGKAGLPTARLTMVEICTLPASGVYAVYAATDAGVFRAVANIAPRPESAVPGQPCGECPAPTVAVHLLDFAGDLQGQRVRLQFVERLRDERHFASVDELSKQIRRDIARAKELL